MKLNSVAGAVLSFTFLLSAGTAFGQSSFLQHRQNGVGLTALLESGANYTGFGAAFGYRFEARCDLGLVVSRVDFDDEVLGRDGSGTSFMPAARSTSGSKPRLRWTCFREWVSRT